MYAAMIICALLSYQLFPVGFLDLPILVTANHHHKFDYPINKEYGPRLVVLSDKQVTNHKAASS
jgi:hypothetical protein